VAQPQLEPHHLRPDSDRIFDHFGKVFGLAEAVDDVGYLREVGEARVALQAQHLVVVGVHRVEAQTGAQQIGGNEVRGAQRVGGHPDQRHRLGLAEDAKPLLRGDLEADRRGHAPPPNARSRSAMMSSGSSRPTEMRIMSSVTPAASRTSTGTCWCVVEAGWMTR